MSPESLHSVGVEFIIHEVPVDFAVGSLNVAVEGNGHLKDDLLHWRSPFEPSASWRSIGLTGLSTGVVRPERIELPAFAFEARRSQPLVKVLVSVTLNFRITLKFGFHNYPLDPFVLDPDSVLGLAMDRKEKLHDLVGPRRGLEPRRPLELDQIAEFEPVYCHRQVRRKLDSSVGKGGAGEGAVDSRVLGG